MTVFSPPGPIPEPKDEIERPTGGKWGVKYRYKKYEYGALLSAEEKDRVQRELADPKIRWLRIGTYRNGEMWLNKKRINTIEFIPPIS